MVSIAGAAAFETVYATYKASHIALPKGMSVTLPFPGKLLLSMLTWD